MDLICWTLSLAALALFAACLACVCGGSVCRFLGRLGALTVVMMIGDRESNRHVRFPSEELVVG